MGQFYGNIALRTDDLDLAAHELTALGRNALVVWQGSITMVYDRGCDDQDIDELARLSRTLSERAECIALASCNHDDDVLLSILCDRGTEVDRYDSTPGYFEGDAASDVDQLIRRTHRTTVGQIASYNAGDSQLMARIAEGFVGGVTW